MPCNNKYDEFPCEDFEEAMCSVIANAELLQRFVLGGDTEYVNLPGGATLPTLRNMVRQGMELSPVLPYLLGVIAKAESSLGEQGAAIIRTAAEQLAQACECSLSAAASAEEARRAAADIPAFAHNTHAFFCLRVNDAFELEMHRAEDGDVVHVEDFDAVEVLPAEARFRLDGGALLLELPFTL